MRRLLPLLALLAPSALYAQGGMYDFGPTCLVLQERAECATPAADSLHLCAADVSGVTQLAYKDSSGVIHDLSASGGAGSPAWGAITGTLSAQTDLQAALDGKSGTAHAHAFGAITGTATDAQLASNYSGVGACGANQWASTLNDNAAPTCTQPAFSNVSGSVTDAQVPDSITVTLAGTASALAANGGNCTGNEFALGVSASGVAECAQPAFSNLSGAVTDAQVPNTITVDLATAATSATTATTAATANAGDSATAFFSSGTIEVARGGNGAAPGADDQTLVSDSTTAGTWRALPSCSNASTSKLLYDTATNTFSCGTDQTGGGGGGPTVARKTADQSDTTAAFVDVTDLTFAVSAATTYSFECHLSYTTAISTTALQVSVNGPASPTALRFTVETSTTATARHNASQNAYNAITNPATGGAATALPVLVAGTLENGANAGTLALRMRTEVSTSAATIQRGSYCVLY